MEDAGAGAFLKRVTIIGAGWAGLSAAVHAVQAGWQVHLLEAAPQAGGRARRVVHQGLKLDNGQHILIGAYHQTLALMRTVGVDTHTHLWRMPLTLRLPDGQGLQLPDWPSPLNMLAGIASARGWQWSEKWAFIKRAFQWQQQRFDCPPTMTVAQLCHGLPTAVMALMIEPLCVSALNLPSTQASAQVFLRVLQDALLGGKGSSDMLIPRADQSTLLPDAALRWLRQHGAQVDMGQHVQDLSSHLSHPVILACPAWEAARLTRSIYPAWSAQAQALEHTAITTVYVQANAPLNWPSEVLALQTGPDAPAQFVFDKGRLSADPALQGVIAAVVSGSGRNRAQITQAVLQQLRDQLSLPQASVWLSVLEKRAAFACTPDLKRPPAQIGHQLLACGDYIQGPYPATLEGAVLSGQQAVHLLAKKDIGENTA